MTTGVNGKTLFLAATGGLLLYSGIKNFGISDTARSLIKGENPTSLTPQTTDSGAATTAASSGASIPNIPGSRKAKRHAVRGPIVAAAPGTSANTAQQYARLHAARYGWVGTQFADLVQLWDIESGWSNIADTRKTGLDAPNSRVYAYGIPQARPATKLPLAGRPPELGGSSDYRAQVRWGLRYILGRYGSPSAALAFEHAHGSY